MPWNSAAIRGKPQLDDPHPDPGGSHAVCLRSQAIRRGDEDNPILSPAKWPVELVLIANEKGRETFICHDRIQQILSPVIQSTYRITAAQTLFFPTPPPGGRFGGHLTPLPRRLLPTSPAILAQTTPTGPATPPSGPPPRGPTSGNPNKRMDAPPTPPRYSPQVSTGAHGNMHHRRGSRNYHDNGLTCHTRAKAFGQMIYLIPTPP